MHFNLKYKKMVVFPQSSHKKALITYYILSSEFLIIFQGYKYLKIFKVVIIYLFSNLNYNIRGKRIEQKSYRLKLNVWLIQKITYGL